MTKLLGKSKIEFVQNLKFSKHLPAEKTSWTYCSDGSCSGDCVGGCDGTPAGGFRNDD